MVLTKDPSTRNTTGVDTRLEAMAVVVADTTTGRRVHSTDRVETHTQVGSTDCQLWIGEHQTTAAAGAQLDTLQNANYETPCRNTASFFFGELQVYGGG